MAGENNAGISFEGVLNGGQRCSDPLVTRNFFSICREGNIEIDSDKDSFTAEIQVFDRQFAHRDHFKGSGYGMSEATPGLVGNAYPNCDLLCVTNMGEPTQKP